jgi:hypothetical protein
MKPRAYPALALLAFFIGTAGADILARTRVGGEVFAHAVRSISTMQASMVRDNHSTSAVPAIGLICAALQKRARTRSTAVIFAVGMLALLYFYFRGHQDAQRALLEEHWTAAALSVGLLPFFIEYLSF